MAVTRESAKGAHGAEYVMTSRITASSPPYSGSVAIEYKVYYTQSVHGLRVLYVSAVQGPISMSLESNTIRYPRNGWTCFGQTFTWTDSSTSSTYYRYTWEGDVYLRSWNRLDFGFAPTTSIFGVAQTAVYTGDMPFVDVWPGKIQSITNRPASLELRSALVTDAAISATGSDGMQCWVDMVCGNSGYTSSYVVTMDGSTAKRVVTQTNTAFVKACCVGKNNTATLRVRWGCDNVVFETYTYSMNLTLNTADFAMVYGQDADATKLIQKNGGSYSFTATSGQNISCRTTVTLNGASVSGTVACNGAVTGSVAYPIGWASHVIAGKTTAAVKVEWLYDSGVIRTDNYTKTFALGSDFTLTSAAAVSPAEAVIQPSGSQNVALRATVQAPVKVTALLEFGTRSSTATADMTGSSVAFNAAYSGDWVHGVNAGATSGIGYVTFSTSYGGATYGTAIKKQITFKVGGDFAPTMTVPASITLNESGSSLTAKAKAGSGVKVSYSLAFGSNTATAAADMTGADVSTALAMAGAWAAAIPNSTSGTATLTVTANYGTRQTYSNRFNVAVNLASTGFAPNFSSLAATRPADVISGWNFYLQGYSKLRLTATASGNNGSTIKTYSFTVGGVNGSGTAATRDFDLPNSGTVSYSATVTDSRGRTASKTGSISVVAYTMPSIGSPTAYRSNASGTAQEDGTSMTAKATANIASCSGKNTATLSIAYKSTAASAYGSENTMTSGQNKIISGLNDETSYDVRFKLSDALNTVYYFAVIPTSIYLMHFKKGGKGVAIGKVAELDNTFDVGWAARFEKEVTFMLQDGSGNSETLGHILTQLSKIGKCT